jgi:expansin (peptidoglycan-binding protein)
MLVARKSGGEYFDLNSTTSSTAEIVSKLGNTKFQYLFAEIDGAVVSEIYPSLPSPISGKQFTISGKINGQNTATIALVSFIRRE